jgi:hypothetical protein
MAELLLGKGWAEPGSLGMVLRDELPDEYIAVADPTVQGCPLDVVVVAPRGLFVLHARDWAGEVQPSRHGAWRERGPSGETRRHPNPAPEARRATDALRAFLRDEFPALCPMIHNLVVLTSPQVRIQEVDGMDRRVLRREDVADAIASAPVPPDAAVLDEPAREALALALRDRQLTAHQRAPRPFVFRSASLLGSGTKVWTIAAAVRHMDRHPEDGMFHLRNGTLAEWLSAQGAEHLAGLAREVVRQRDVDPRIPLETFLIGTGLVQRPRLVGRPQPVDLGCALPGEMPEGRVRLQKGRGRGYLFGTLRCDSPWLQVEPRSFSGQPLEAVVSADTERLSIDPTPWQGEILVESSASQEPISIPVQVRVVGMPSGLRRYLLRPLAGLLSAGLLGAGLGWALAAWVLPEPGWFAGLTSPSISWAAACALWLGLFWAVPGWARGVLQPLAWSAAYATGRWLLRTLVWGATLSLLAGLGTWAWRKVAGDPGTGLVVVDVLAVNLALLSLTILPAALGEMRAARRTRGAPVLSAGQFLQRPARVAAAGLALALLLVAGAPVVGPAWQQLEVTGTLAAVQGWTGEQWAQLETRVNAWADQVDIPYYGRLVPPPVTPRATAAPGPAPANAGGKP